MVCASLFILFASGADDFDVFTVERPPELRSLKNPSKVERRGKYVVRTYVLKPGDSFCTPRGVRTWVRRVEDGAVVFGRWSEWTVKHNPRGGMGHSTGSRERLYLLETDSKSQKVRLEVRTQVRLSWYEVMAF